MTLPIPVLEESHRIMSYFDYPRLHFSGGFKASPSTINNTPNNYDPEIYPTPDELEEVELYWNPLGDGGFEFVNCVVTRVDYADGTSSTKDDKNPDPIIGQSVASVKSPGFPLGAGLVDLDPMQQNVSEIWGMTVQIGDAGGNLTGNFAAISFYAIWGQAQGQQAPHSSASGSGVYQSTLKDAKLNGSAGSSRFLKYFADNPTANLSININLNTHNNKPPIWRFNADRFDTMLKAGVPQSVLTKIMPMQMLVQNLNPDSTLLYNSPRGDVPVQNFVLFMLQQYLTTEEYNANIDVIMKTAEVKYENPSMSTEFLYGQATGTAAPVGENEPSFFVRNRMMCPQPSWVSQLPANPCYFAPFVTSADGKTVTVNLGNSLPTELPGFTPWEKVLGELWLVSLPKGEIAPDKVTKLVKIPYDETFISQQAGFFHATLNEDVSQVPLGILSVPTSGTQSLLLAENKDGYYLRADQFVYRMNPGITTTPDFPRGDTASVEVHALQFGQPVIDNTEITLTMMDECAATLYTRATLGTSGTNGIENVSVPQDALRINTSPEPPPPGDKPTGRATALTKGGVATFELSCTAPGNPRHYVDGQVYFLNYGFSDPSISALYIQDINDLVSVQVYSEKAEEEPADILAKWGRLYKIMNFLTDEEKVKQIDRRNVIKLLLEKPFTELQHMPVTRDMSEPQRAKIVSWINTLNSQ